MFFAQLNSVKHLAGPQDGGVQVHDRAVPQEAERRAAVPSARPLLAVPPAHQGPPLPEVHQARQGQAPRLQEQAG